MDLDLILDVANAILAVTAVLFALTYYRRTRREERAKGILMQRLNLTEAEAFRRLQKRSQVENRKMGEIAEAIVMANDLF